MSADSGTETCTLIFPPAITHPLPLSIQRTHIHTDEVIFVSNVTNLSRIYHLHLVFVFVIGSIIPYNKNIQFDVRRTLESGVI